MQWENTLSGCLETGCKVLNHCAYSRPWRFEMLGIWVKWADSAVFLTLQLSAGSGAPSTRQGFVLIAQCWSWWVAGLSCRAGCRPSVACSDDTLLGFASCWIPVKTHLSWLSEHALWGEGQWWVWWAKDIVFYRHWCSVIKFLMQKINCLEIGSCFAPCSRLYFYHLKKKSLDRSAMVWRSVLEVSENAFLILWKWQTALHSLWVRGAFGY